jgi:hypothetical protein
MHPRGGGRSAPKTATGSRRVRAARATPPAGPGGWLGAGLRGRAGTCPFEQCAAAPGAFPCPTEGAASAAAAARLPGPTAVAAVPTGPGGLAAAPSVVRARRARRAPGPAAARGAPGGGGAVQGEQRLPALL